MSEFFIDYSAAETKVQTERLPMVGDYDGKKERNEMGKEEFEKARERRDYYFCDEKKTRLLSPTPGSIRLRKFCLG
jgi:hypothetical protein